jgi:putative ABC transport system permease protein
MLTNYLKIAFRNLVKNKTYSLINIIGLALGMAVSVLILSFVMHEFSYDKFHVHKNRIYRILAKVKMGDNDMQFTSFSAKLAPALKEYNPQVQDYVRVRPAYQKVVIKNPEKGGQLFYEQHFLFADPSFFKVFSFKIKEGNPAAMLEKPFTMVISERAARKYFGTQNALGKTLVYDGKHIMQITGIAQDPPSNSTFDFDFVASAVTFPKLSEQNKNNWEQAGIFTTYLLLDSEKSRPLVEKNIKREGNKTGAFDSMASYKLESFGGIHLGNNFDDSGNTKLIYVFAGIAVVILFLALFNYMSLTTARATMRAKEVGIRKVVGAGMSGLVRQFYVESVLVCTLSFALAFLFVDLMRRPFYNLLDLRIDASFLLSPEFIGFLAALLVVSALIAGSYPALILSGFAPLEVLKGKFAGMQKGASVRRVFMVFQFAVSITLIVCSLVVNNQIQFMQTKKLGLYKDQVLSIPLSATMAPNYFAMRNEIREQTGVQDVTFTNAGLFKGYNMFFLKNFTTQKDVGVAYMVVDNHFSRTLGLKWKTAPAAESWKDRNYVVLNETAIRQLGIKGNPIGQKVGVNDEVAGILKDFHFSSIQSEIKAMGLFVVSDTSNVLKVPGGAGVLYVRLDPKASLKEKIATIGGIFKKYDREKPFEYYFLDDAFNETFKTETRMSKMFSVFTAFAIFIACMGLFGLVTFTAEIRTKEIGIRKVLGASVAGIVTLLSRDFIMLILVAIVLAIPSAYYFMNKWLQDFTYRIQIPVWISLVSSLAAIAIALLTISFQSIKAAWMDPVKSLKSD